MMTSDLGGRIAAGIPAVIFAIVIVVAGGPVFAAGAALLGVAPAAMVGDAVEGRGGTAVAVWQMSSDLGSVVGPLAAGLLIDNGSYATALLVSAAVVAGCSLTGLRGRSAP